MSICKRFYLICHCLVAVLFFLIAAPMLLYSQPAQIIFKHYGVAEGFNSNEAMSIVQTRDGLIWISSADGLIRFDSKTFKYYRHSNADTNSIAHNYCRAMKLDKHERIWIVVNDGLDIFDPTTETFNHVQLAGTAEAVKPKTFYYDKIKDVMWVGTQQGLYFARNSSKGKLQNASRISRDTTLATKNILTITPGGKDCLWITSINKIIKFNTTTGATENYVVPPVVNGYNNAGNVYIISSYLDKKETLWMGTASLGLFSFNTHSKQFDQYTYRDIKKEDNTIFSITQTNLPGQEDILFMGASGFGFAAFNMENKRFTSYSSGTYNTSLGIKGNAYGLYCYDNKLWIGSSTGLHCYDYSLQLFDKKDLTAIAGGATLLPVQQMTVERNSTARDERLWLFIPYKDAYIYDLVNEKILPVPQAIKKYTATDAGIFSMFIDSKNILWLGTNAYGLVGYDINKKTLLTEKQYFYKSRDWVQQFFEDSRGNLWFCTYNGLFVLDTNRKNVQPVAAVNNLIKSQGLAKSIVSITEDEYGKLWLTADFSGKRNAAIIKLDVQKNSASIIYNEQQTTNSNQNPVDLREILSNKKGKIFVVFRSDNIAWFNSNSTGKITLNELGRAQGLNNAVIDQLLTDAAGNIWCSNAFGVAQYKISQQTFNHYNFTSYELNATNNPSIYISPNTGNFYIGQSNSFLLFNYKANSNNIKITNLLFNELKIYNNVYPKKIKDGDKITLSYKEDMISIEFALLSYSNAHDNTYSWKLEGLEKEWNVSKNNIAIYNHLKPGNYTLLVKAANSNGDWTSVPVKLHIVITPPFYATWWFRLVVILLIAALVWWLVQRRISRIKEKFALRNRIASDLHDEIGSTLTSINILSTVSQQAMDNEPQQAKELLQQISSQSKTIQQNMSDIVWSIRPDNEKMENLIVRIREYVAQTLEPLNIDTVIEADDWLIDTSLPMQYRKDILLICKEAINNIAKHSGASAATIVFRYEKNKMFVTISDNGRWKKRQAGTGTKTMQERAVTLGGHLTIDATGSGSVISLAVPLP